MSWYYSKNGTQLGPITEEELSSKIKSGEVTATEMIWQEGMPDWKPSSQVANFQGMAPASAPPAIQGNVPMAQPPAMSAGQYQQIPNYLWQSIVATVLCCMPFGVVGIVFAAKVDGLVARGDIAGAQAASKSAKMWTNVAVGCGLLVIVLYLVVAIFAAANS